MTLANKITVFRLILIPFFMAFCLISGPDKSVVWDILAFVTFGLATISDKLDGYVAKKYNQITDFGKIMDPLADKLLVFAALAIFTGRNDIHSVILWIIIARELAITSMRVICAGKGTIVAAAFSGKMKTVVQLIAILIILALPIFTALGLQIPEGAVYWIKTVLSWLMAAVTLWSGLDYLIANRSLMSTK